MKDTLDATTRRYVTAWFEATWPRFLALGNVPDYPFPHIVDECEPGLVNVCNQIRHNRKERDASEDG